MSPSEGQYASFREKTQMASASPDRMPWGQRSQQASCSMKLRGSSYSCSKAGENESHHKTGRKINICHALYKKSTLIEAKGRVP